MRKNNKLTKLDEYLQTRFLIDVEPSEMVTKQQTSTENNLGKLIEDGNELVHFNVEKQSITLLFSDKHNTSGIEIFIDKKGELKTKLITNIYKIISGSF